MNDLISRITNAIFRQEGESPAHPNPGNLRDAPWFPKGTDGKRYYPGEIINGSKSQKLQYSSSGGFWVPRSRAEGIAGAAHVVALHIAQGDSLEALITRWAPPTDGNDTKAYIAHVAEWAGIPDTKLPLWNFIQDQDT